MRDGTRGETRMKKGDTVSVHIKHNTGEKVYVGTVVKFFRRGANSKALVGITTEAFGYTLYNPETRRAVGGHMGEICWYTV